MGDNLAERFREELKEGILRAIGKRKTSKSAASQHNRELILRFDEENMVNGLKDTTRLNTMVILHNFAEFLGTKKFEEVDKQTIAAYIANLKEKKKENDLKKKKKESNDYDLTIELVKTKLKRFYKWLSGGENYPDSVKWLRGKGKNETLDEKKILKEEEVKKMIEVADSWRDKAMVAVLYESACRIGEFLGMKIEDLVFDGYGVRVKVSGKTGEREIRLVFSVPYLKEWLKRHPQKDRKEAWLWSVKGDKPMTESNVNYMLKKLAKKSGIEKEVHPHLLRHSRLTYLAGRLKESYLRKFAGWTGDSNMVKTYVHLNDKDVDLALLKDVYGISKFSEVEEVERALTPKVCPNCGEHNPADVSYCLRCHFPLNPEEAKARERQFLALLTPELINKLIEKRFKQLIEEWVRERRIQV